MGVFIFFCILSSFIFLHVEASDANFPPVKCGPVGPDILFPFQVSSQHLQRWGHPNFKLFCKQNKTMIHFPSYGDLVVKSIHYDIKKLDLLDPKNCVHEVFLNLNLSLTPFHYYYVVKNYKYLNCSSRLSPPFMEVPCLSGSSYHVYVVESDFDWPVSCKPVKTIAIPFSYSPFLSDDSFGLGLTWDLTGEDSEAKGSWYRLQSILDLQKCFRIPHGRVLGVTSFLFMVATMIGVKTYCSTHWLNRRKNQCEVEKLRGDYQKIEP